MKKSNILLNGLAVICLLTIMTLLVSLSACSDDDGPTPPTPPIDPDSAMIQDLNGNQNLRVLSEEPITSIASICTSRIRQAMICLILKIPTM